jgi:hypothetical protein
VCSMSRVLVFEGFERRLQALLEVVHHRALHRDGGRRPHSSIDSMHKMDRERGPSSPGPHACAPCLLRVTKVESTG